MPSTGPRSARHLGHATPHVLDRFHAVRWFASGLVEVRRRLQRREPRGHVSRWRLIPGVNAQRA